MDQACILIFAAARHTSNWKVEPVRMRKPRSMRGLEELGRVRLSPNFYMRDFLYSEIANFYTIPNIPEYPDLRNVGVGAGARRRR